MGGCESRRRSSLSAPPEPRRPRWSLRRWRSRPGFLETDSMAVQLAQHLGAYQGAQAITAHRPGLTVDRETLNRLGDALDVRVDERVDRLPAEIPAAQRAGQLERSQVLERLGALRPLLPGPDDLDVHHRESV